MRILRPGAAIVALLGCEIAATVALHRLGRVDGFALPKRALAHWLLHAQTEELIAVTARLAGLVLAWWLLVTTVLSVAHQVVPGWRRLRALDFLTPKAVRRIVERALAVGLGASFGLSGVHAIGAATVPGRPRVDIPVVRSAPPAIRVPEPSPRASGGPTPHDPGVVVRAGDNLWLIAKRALGGEHSPDETAAYWRRVIATNAGGLRSRDPDLIFPGEHIVLPPLPGPDPTAG